MYTKRKPLIIQFYCRATLAKKSFFLAKKSNTQHTTSIDYTMEEKPPCSKLKRPLTVDDDDDGSSKPPMQKRPRFPKGKKVKAGDEIVKGSSGIVIGAQEEGAVDVPDPKLAAKERANRRSEITTELFNADISAAEVNYEDNTDFVDDGIHIEPFNLNKEREEGYFDADGNFVEYVNENEIKDAWLDSVDSVYTEKSSHTEKTEEDGDDLSSEDIGKIKRRIANLLEPGETVLQALRRLKGTTHGRKKKMPEETKHIFDQLTEDSMKLMENGDYNVYNDEREVFEREAEGYERLARAKDGTSANVRDGTFNSNGAVFSDDVDNGVAFLLLPGPGSVPSVPDASGDAADAFDMFAEDDGNPTSNSNVGSGSAAEPALQQGVDVQTDYVYDESSGYYYSSSTGYYYDPTSGLYCSADSGRWYSYNEEMGTYIEIQGEAEHPVT